MSTTAGMTRDAIAPTLGAKLRGYVALTKPRIIEQLLITTVPAMIVAEKGLPSIWLMIATVLGGTFAAAGANAANMWWDRDIDAVMKRTSHRPLVRGTISPNGALVFAIAVEVFAFAWMVAFVNVLAACLALSAALFYVFVYTLWLKRAYTSNIVIGGAAGAVPVLVGWAAVTNGVSFAPVVMFAIIFVWTPPHFWALAYKYRHDYSAADVPMLPSVASMNYTSGQIVGYTILLWALSLLLGPVAGLGLVYWVAANVTAAVFLAYAVKLSRDHTEKTAMKLFHWSITYLTVLFCAMAIDPFVHIG
jgi:heme o synthase